jgi:hypothetical protein
MRIRSRVSWALLLVLFFAQGALAANVCFKAAGAAYPVSEAAQDAHCGEVPAALNLCLKHCADQSDDIYSPPPLAAPTTPVLTVPGAPDGVRLSRTPIVAANASHDPPIPIRFCSFLI